VDPVFATLNTILVLSWTGAFLNCLVLIFGRGEKLFGQENSPTRMILYLSISDIIGSLTWFVGNFLDSCPTVAALSCFGFLSAAFWTCAIGFYLCCLVKGRDPPHEAYNHAVCWGIPLILIVCQLALNGYVDFPPPEGCWIANDWQMQLFFEIPQFLCLFLTLTFLSVVIYNIQQNKEIFKWSGKESNKQQTMAQRRLFFMQLCFLVYSLGYLFQIVSGANYQLFTVGECLGAFQGLLNAILTNERRIVDLFERMFRGRTPKSDPTETTHSSQTVPTESSV